MPNFDISELSEVDIREDIIWENQRRDPKAVGTAVFSTKCLHPCDDPPGSCDPTGAAQQRADVPVEEGFRELKGWEVDHSSLSDSEGWTYFPQFPEAGDPSEDPALDAAPVLLGEIECTASTLVRRRYWVRTIVKERDYNRALLLLQAESGKKNVRFAYNLEFVRDVMQSIPHCVSLVHENERLRRKKKATEEPHFSKDAMRSSDVHIWTDAYSDVPSVQDVLGSETRATITAPPPHNGDRRSISSARRSASYPTTNFLCATVDSVAVPDGWAVVRGFNFIVDAGTNLAGWQFASSFFNADKRGGVGSLDYSLSQNSVGAQSGESTRRGQTNWSSEFDEASHCVRRRLWCRIMCPAQYLDRALAACERYISKRNRGDILTASNVFVEIDGCCTSSFKSQRLILKDRSLEYYSARHRTGVFPLGPRTRVRVLDSRVADHKNHPMILRVEDVGDQSHSPDYLTLAMRSESNRKLWCDVIRNQVGLLDPSGKDDPGGPPEDPSVPIYSSSLSSHTSMNTAFVGLVGSPSMMVSESEMNALHRPLIPNENGNGVKDSFIEDGQPDSDENNAATCHHSSAISDVEVMSPFLVNKDSEVPLPGPISQDGSGNKEEEAVTSMGVPQPPVLDDTPSPSGPLQTNSDDVPADNARTEDNTVDPHFELLLMGSACRKRLLGEHVYHVRFIWVEKTPAGQAFHWAKSEGRKSENKSFLVRDIASIELAPHKRKSIFMPNIRHSGGGDDVPPGGGSVAPEKAKTVRRKGSDVSSVNSSANSDHFDSQAVVIRCRAGTMAGDLKISGVEIKLESNEVALKWIELIRSMMDFNM